MVLMGVLENRKEYFFAFMGLLFYKSKKKRSKCIVKSNHYVTQNMCRFIETFFRYQLVLKLLEWVFRLVYN